MARRERAALGIVVALGVLGAAGAILWRLAAPPTGPVEVPFDRVACERCRMLVSDPRFAVQLHEPSGTVRFFDDPGCALLYRAAAASSAPLYFHDFHGTGWLEEAELSFERVAESPMGYGLAAVARGSREGTLTTAEALAGLEAQRAESAP